MNSQPLVANMVNIQCRLFWFRHHRVSKGRSNGTSPKPRRSFTAHDHGRDPSHPVSRFRGQSPEHQAQCQQGRFEGVRGLGETVWRERRIRWEVFGVSWWILGAEGVFLLGYRFGLMSDCSLSTTRSIVGVCLRKRRERKVSYDTSVQDKRAAFN